MMETGWTGSIFYPHHFEHTGKVRETVKIKQLLCGVLAAAVPVSYTHLDKNTERLNVCGLNRFRKRGHSMLPKIE